MMASVGSRVHPLYGKIIKGPRLKFLLSLSPAPRVNKHTKISKEKMFTKQMLWTVVALFLCLTTVLSSPVPDDSSSNSSESGEAKVTTAVPIAVATPQQLTPVEVQASTTEQVEIASTSPSPSQNEA